MSELGGYVGRILYVDLARGVLAEERPSESLLRSFIGGYGLGARILYDRVPARVDALGPDNVLGLVTGPLTGTPTIAGSRYVVVGKSPLTGGWGDANSGGHFGPALKFSGYDAVFVTGKADKPAYLLLEDGQAELRWANDLWGLDSVETEAVLEERHGKDVEVACIGPAGERLSLISCVITDGGRAAGRSGLGAVMGSKKLKAVVARGRSRPSVANPDRVKELRNKYLPSLKTGEGELMSKYGTAGSTAELVEIGRTPIKNWRGTYPDDFPNVEALDGPALAAYETEKYGCWGCPIRCGATVRWESGGKMNEGHRPEYETLASLGTYCGIDDAKSVMATNDICNRAGLDTISAGAAISFAMECYENGLLSAGQLEGLDLEWGNGEAATELLRRIVERQGLGDLLADGVWRASRKLGKESEAFAIHAGGQELPAHDPRHGFALGLLYQISPTPGRHTQGGADAAEMPPEDLTVFGLDPALAEKDHVGFQARAYRAEMAWWNVFQCSGLCYFPFFCLEHEYVQDLLSAVTGWDIDMAECLETGERIEVVRHLFGLRQGHNPLRVRVPPRVMGDPPLETGPTAGVTVDVTELRDTYLELMEWDPQSTMPGQSRLKELGLAGLAGVAQGA
jgi:aldehyde:ferredoxin oxidoreductase